MRGTIHLVTRDDALLLPGLMAPLYARDLQVNVLHGPALRNVDVAEITAAARALVEAEPRVTTVLGRLLAERWPRDPARDARVRRPRHPAARPGAAAGRLGQVGRDHVDHRGRVVRHRVGGPVRPGRPSRSSRSGSCSGTCAPSVRPRSRTSRAGPGSAVCAPSSTGWATGSCATGRTRRPAACDRASCSTSPDGPLPDPRDAGARALPARLRQRPARARRPDPDHLRGAPALARDRRTVSSRPRSCSTAGWPAPGRCPASAANRRRSRSARSHRCRRRTAA